MAKAIIWSIAGSDSGGGAGIQADLKTAQALGVHCCTVIAAITAQNSMHVTKIEAVSSEMLDAQLAALAQDMPPAVIKTGLLGSCENLRTVCHWVDKLRTQYPALKLVVDPVLKASTGAIFADDALLACYQTELLPRANVVTPNLKEAAQLTLNLNQPHVFTLVATGGDERTEQSCDWIGTANVAGRSGWSGWLIGKRIATTNNHGTGCAFATSIACYLALGYDALDATVLAKVAVTRFLKNSYAAGLGSGTLGMSGDAHVGAVEKETIDFPRFVSKSTSPPVFPALINQTLGLYAIVESSQKAKSLLEQGIGTLQLRVKSDDVPFIRNEIKQFIGLSQDFPKSQLFINDHWQLALEEGAYGVHLGQEDLDVVDLNALARAGIRLGISTHTPFEVARALAFEPSYIACGPIFYTATKAVPYPQQGLSQLTYWVCALNKPIVAIGGVNLSNLADVVKTGCAGIAMIGAFYEGHERVHELIQLGDRLFHAAAQK